MHHTSGSNLKQVAVLPGEGIGPEVIAQAKRVLEWFIAHRALPVAATEHAYGAAAYRRHRQVLPEATKDAIRRADAVLFGATGGPELDAIPPDARRAGSLLRIRSMLTLFANVRPVKAIPALYEASTLKRHVLEGVDLVIVREGTGGVYFGEPRGIETLPNGERRGFDTQTYTSSEVDRVARFAFTLARTRRGRVCSVEKANVMQSGVFWRQQVTALHAAEFRDVELTHTFADNCAMQLVRAPVQFDVIVTDNLFGDLLSDCAAMTAGSLGMLPSGSFGPEKPDGRRCMSPCTAARRTSPAKASPIRSARS